MKLEVGSDIQEFIKSRYKRKEVVYNDNTDDMCQQYFTRCVGNMSNLRPP